jgi:4-hydroxy-tetrahydrodipicolinate reductase
MGERIIALSRLDARFELTAALDLLDPPRGPAAPAPAFDVLIDFSSDAGARAAAALALDAGAALLIGTTALSTPTLDTLARAAERLPVMIAPNTSLGVAVLSHLVGEAARLLGPRCDIDLIETHHKAKLDAPSGTARRLAQAIRDRAGRDLPPERVHSVRAGDVVGEHIVEFNGTGERLRLVHTASTRDVFALGALHAAAWLHRRPPGRYVIEQALGLA